jgi:hypothetical protein
LRFCLADGTSLVPAFAERVTRQDEAATVRMETPVRPTSSYDPPPKAPRAFKIILGLLAVVVFFGAIAMVGLLIFINKNRVRSVSTPTPPTPAATSTPGGENDRLGRELANAKKQLGETNGKQPGDVPEPPKPPAPAANARANSPKDGFLALRELPSTDIGELVVKIPHGAAFTLGECVPIKTKVDTRDGHWCMATYNGNEGWVFDAWVDKGGR